MSGPKRVFVSSTVYDLEDERAFIRALLESRTGSVTFKPILSEEPSFPITPPQMAEKHSYQICIDDVALCDYVILLIKKRYGAPIVEHDGQLISITQREYREAFRRRLPIFTFVDHRTWNARNRYRKTGKQSFVPPKHIRVFDFLDEIGKQTRNNWMYFYKGLDDLATALKQVLFSFDDSIFVADVTIPDGSIVRTEETFEKIWEIKNSGCVEWDGRSLREENAGASGLEASATQIAIPHTQPGETVRLAVAFRAPRYPCTCESYWKMVDRHGRYLFPHKKGLYCRVKVVY